MRKDEEGEGADREERLLRKDTAKTHTLSLLTHTHTRVSERAMEVPRIPATCVEDLEKCYRERRHPVIIEAALDPSMCSSIAFELDTLQELAEEHYRGAVVHAVVHDAAEKTFYRDKAFARVGDYFQHVRNARETGTKQTEGLMNGIAIPVAALHQAAPECESLSKVPDVLHALHTNRSLQLRDLAGRRMARLFVSTQGFFGRCHYDRLGLPFFTAQVRGTKTWYMYAPSALPLDRQESFDNAAPFDFSSEDVRHKFADVGWRAQLQEGDLLLIPPYFYHAVHHIGDYNVNLDYACQPDRVWEEALANEDLAMEDLIGILGSRVFLTYAVPAALLPFGDTLIQSRLYLLMSSFTRGELSLVLPSLFRNKVADARAEHIHNALQSCRSSAASNDVAAQLLESCVACDIVFHDAVSVMRGIARLYRHVSDDEDAKEALDEGLRLVKSVTDEVGAARGNHGQNKNDQYNTGHHVQVSISECVSMYSDTPEIVDLFRALFGDNAFVSS